jgi:hypothetical protein
MNLGFLSLTPRFNEVMQRPSPFVTASTILHARETAKAVSGSIDRSCTSLKRGINIDYSAAADSFCPCCLAGAGRGVAARFDAFLRCK